MNFEDGRIRVITPTAQNNGLDVLSVDGNIDLPGGKRGAYDYFIMDYLQNVRMILTEESHVASNKATMETNRSTLEESIFGQTGSANEVATTRYAKPSGWTGNSSSQVSRLGTNSGHNIGPNALQKVMAGDKITATVLYYHEGSPGGNNTSMVNTLIGSMSPIISGSSGATGAVKSNASNITSQLGSVNGFINAVQPNGSNPSSSTPQAFLTILFFDERFNFIEAADGGAYQQQVAASVGSNGSTLQLPDKKAPKNGYVYVYVSNQSNNHVYFDDFNVTITQGNIVEENHYYSYGLKIATISSRKYADSYEGLVKNNYLYQGAYSELDDDIGWNDFALRNYDPQIGKWVQQDPYQQFASPYLSMGNDPIQFIDPTGGVVPIMPALSTTASTAITLQEVIVTSSKAVSMLKSSASIFNCVSTTINVITSTIDIFCRGIATPQIGDRTLIYARGMSNAILNANTLGLTDWWGSTSNLDDYNDPYDQEAYLNGRIAGDAIVMAQSGVQIDAGMGGGVSAALATGGTSIIVGGAVAAHGALAGAVATSDAAWAAGKLMNLNLSAKTTNSGNSSQSSNNNIGNKIGSTAKNKESGTQTASKTLWWGKGKERLDVENPNPTQRRGQVHYQNSKGQKFIYDAKSNTFKGAPRSVNKLLENKRFKQAIDKGLKYLGE